MQHTIIQNHKYRILVASQFSGKIAGLERLNDVSTDGSYVFDLAFYHSQEAIEAEWQKLWKKAWVIAGWIISRHVALCVSRDWSNQKYSQTNKFLDTFVFHCFFRCLATVH